MPTYENPAADASEAAEALRGVAHASRVITDPGDTYRVLGSLSTVLASLQQSLDQLAEWHDRNADHAATDDGDRRMGQGHATVAAEFLRDAADRTQQAHRSLNQAFNHNGRIAWQPSLDTKLTRRENGRGQLGRLAPPSAFGTDSGSREGPDSLGR
jgi:hypothetical protein